MKKQNRSELRTFSPRTPSIRHTVLFRNPDVSNNKPLKSITKGQKQNAGRINGSITVRRRGGGHKRKFRIIDFKRQETDNLLIIQLEYDPNRTSSIARVQNLRTEEIYYILAATGMKPGQILQNQLSSNSFNVLSGTSYNLSDIPIGFKIHNMELKPGKGGQIIRSAGSVGHVMSKDLDQHMAKVKLPSGRVISVSIDCRASLGQVSNEAWKNHKLGKAGRSRWYSRRPKVRGVAMNPVDHPHGGGEGKTSGGRPSVSPWGKLTKGVPTGKRKK